MTGPKLPDEVVIDLAAGTVTFDGEPFPWHIALDGIEVPTCLDAGATVILTIPVMEVRIK